jgi:hypothetical protein
MSLGYVRRARLAVVPLAVLAAATALPFVAGGSCSDPSSNDSPDAKIFDHQLIDYDATYANDSGTSLDGGNPSFTDGWVHVPWAPQCALYLPADGGLASVEAPQWIPCASGRVGCQEMARTWGDKTSATAPLFYVRPTSEDSTELYIYRDYAPYQSEYFVWDSVSGIEVAWRYNGNGKDCSVRLGDIAAGEVAISEGTLSGTSVQEYRQIFGSPTEAMAKQNPDYVFAPLSVGFSPSIFMSNSAASSTVSSIYFGQINQLKIRDRVANTIDSLDASAGGQPLTVSPYPTIVGDDVFFTAPEGIYAWSRGSGSQLLLGSTAAKYEHDLTSDGTSLVWIESSGLGSNGYASAILYTSPFATSAAGVVPHQVMNVGCSSALCQTSIHQGYVTVGLDSINDSTNQFLLLRLSDAAYWRLANGAVDLWGLGTFANDEVWIPALRGSYYTIERVAVTSLGAPLTD